RIHEKVVTNDYLFGRLSEKPPNAKGTFFAKYRISDSAELGEKLKLIISATKLAFLCCEHAADEFLGGGLDFYTRAYEIRSFLCKFA
ncbi:MAG: hypothetical protein FWD60_12360, partial [Candidatus Azobacteroides sp.]|nr:hypothetical protein [Candidatus Azobacteroides sp.]